MNHKRRAIEQFIEKSLVQEIENEFEGYTSAAKMEKEDELQKLRVKVEQAVGDIFDEHGKIKEQYLHFPIVQNYLKLQIEIDAITTGQQQVHEVFNAVYEFFSRYFDNGDFLSKRRYGTRNCYVLPYNGEEVRLAWTNHDQYYVKTGEYFQNYTFQVGSSKVTFILEKAETENNNVKGEKKFFVLSETNCIEEDKTGNLILRFQYRPLEKGEAKQSVNTIQDEIIKEIVNRIRKSDYSLKPLLIRPLEGGQGYIEKHLRTFFQRQTSDYFIHKGLNLFLRHELDFFIKNEILGIDALILENQSTIAVTLAKARLIDSVCKKIIEFLAQIENFQRRLYEKRKFILSTNYCMTLDKIPESFYNEIARNELQIQEWKRLYNLDEITRNTLFKTNGKKRLGPDFLKSNPHLVLDTQFFSDDFRDRLIGSLENIDDQLDGIIFKSENYQALRLLNKYRGRIKCIYIDPPYNTGSDEFLYKDNYRHSSWLAMMKDRLQLARDLLRDDGVIFISIDDNEVHYLRILMDEIFGEKNFLAKFVWNTEGSTDNQLEVKIVHEYILLYVKNAELKSDAIGFAVAPDTKSDSKVFKEYVENTAVKNGPGNPAREVVLPKGFPCEVNELNLPSTTVNAKFYDDVATFGYIPRDITRQYCVEYPVKKDPIVVKEGVLQSPCRVFTGWANIEKLNEFMEKNLQPIQEPDGAFSFYLSKNGVVMYKRERKAARHILSVIRGVGTTNQARSGLEHMNLSFQYPKPVDLIKYLIKIGSNSNDIILDFFAGSGTTAAAVLQLNQEEKGKRKCISIEMGNYFETILKPRIQKAVFSQEWKDGKPLSAIGISFLFKYNYVEQYEDTLNNITFKGIDRTLEETLYGLGDYFIKYMLDFETRESLSLSTIKAFDDPFNYKLRIGGEEGNFQALDLIETFNYFLGIRIEKTFSLNDNDANRKYRIVLGSTDRGKRIIVIWRSILGIDYTKDREFIEKTILKEEKFDRVFMNCDSLIVGAESIESEFKKYME